ncbi:hypothetical protein BV898_06314 [Hypsibius exemplaris]|uniref:Uncharacterized protein n=1 Tax=Hypsibius exemplaris TaxID=2072580 RepID=A0A1W0WX52_HYPEX|nr:hypothetical protein BV898_06314 [Hypsibius exemplaris]
MERLSIWSGNLILLLHLSCLESRSDLGHSEVRQNVDGKDCRPFVQHSRGISEFHGSGVRRRSIEGPGKTEPRHYSEEDVENHENSTKPPLEVYAVRNAGYGSAPRGGLSGSKLG